ncbi:transient receptor potential cation channel subfamily M member 2-like isoform X2 [Ambystoma mexicanum]|uniref:transient receptor potential cation channel subfamily M member 2-like isoform X2 n=1 Tax=Ambystoma mexicanum TaxID=8296 RepID=UPI0037E92445
MEAPGNSFQMMKPNWTRMESSGNNYSFGECTIKKRKKKVIKFVRITQDLSAEALLDLMLRKWKLSMPNLLLSMNGGGKDFIMKPRLKKTFGKALIKAAQSTGAWIITGGTREGVTKHVGEAVRDFTRSCDTDIVVLGIVPWGLVYNNTEWKPPCEYTLEDGNLGCLDTNHSHFIMVDDGSVAKRGIEIPLRNELEKHISQQTVTKGDIHIKIPVVCVALEGGEGTLKSILHSLENNTPCVIIEGSGRVADVITQVADGKHSDIHSSLIEDKLCCYFEEGAMPEISKKIQDIVGYTQLLTIFRADREDAQGIDEVILDALLASCKRPSSEKWESTLELAVSWDKLHIARSILNCDWLWEPKDLYPVMTIALIEDKPNFVQLFLDHGVNLREYATDERLTCLYKEITLSAITCSSGPLKDLLAAFQTSSNHVETPWSIPSTITKILKLLLHGFTLTSDVRSHMTGKETDTLLKCPIEDGCEMETFEHPVRDLLIWAILQNRVVLAEALWSQSEDSIVSGLACCTILRQLSKYAQEDKDASDGMLAGASRFEELATGVLTESCKKHDAQGTKISYLVFGASSTWGQLSSLEMALNAEAMNFISHGSVQMSLTQFWWGNLSVDNGFIQVLLCMLCFPLIFAGLVTFRKEEDECKEKGRCKRLEEFFQAPVVIFYWNVISYIGFLWLFAYVLMMDFHASPSWREYLLYAWTFTIFCEEVRQLFDGPQEMSLKKRCKYYIEYFWNQVDILALLCFSTGIICRFFAVTLYTGKVLLSLDYAVFCFRLMQIFSVSRVVGPKVNMMWKMMKDISSFLFPLVVWIVSFGVASQAIKVDNEENLSWIFWNIMYMPYRTLFGDIPVDFHASQMNDTDCSPTGDDPQMPKCPYNDGSGVTLFPEWLTVTLLCLYLLFANILLLNLLIAMFNFTFQQVQDQTDQVWMMQRFELIDEYYNRPPAPSPFIIICHLISLVKAITSCTEQKKSGDCIDIADEHARLSWSAQNRDDYLQHQDEEKRQRIEYKVDKMLQQYKSDDEKQCRMDRRLESLENQVSQVSESLNWIMDALAEGGLGSKGKPPDMGFKIHNTLS